MITAYVWCARSCKCQLQMLVRLYYFVVMLTPVSSVTHILFGSASNIFS